MTFRHRPGREQDSLTLPPNPMAITGIFGHEIVLTPFS
jgi:hypothetical protein